MSERSGSRRFDVIRPVEVIPGFLAQADGSALYQAGRTRVLCVATLEDGTPSWLPDSQGWLTAEYTLLPYATVPRVSRPRREIDGRALEIKRLIGRVLRASVDRRRFPGYTIRLDCDVLEADGGTRTAAISGATVALGELIQKGLTDGRLSEDPRLDTIVAISVGRVGGENLLDLDYSEDSRADIDLNIAGTADGRLVEVQGTSESAPLAIETWQNLVTLAAQGLRQVWDSIKTDTRGVR